MTEPFADANVEVDLDFGSLDEEMRLRLEAAAEKASAAMDKHFNAISANAKKTSESMVGSFEDGLQKMQRAAALKSRQLSRELSIKSKVSWDFDDTDATRQRERTQQQYDRNPIKAPVKAKMDGFQAEVVKQAQKLARDASINLPLTADGERLRAAVMKDVAEIERLARVEVPVDPELAAEARAKLQAQLKSLETAASIRTQLDFDRSRDLAALRARLVEMQESVRGNSIKVGIVTAGTAAAIAAIDEVARNRTAKVKVDVDRSSLSLLERGAQRGEQNLRNMFDRAGSAAASFAGLAAKASLAVIALGAAAPAIGALAVALSAAAGAAGALAVAGIGAAAIGIASIKTGLSGVGDAFKAMGADAASGGGQAADHTRAVADAQDNLTKAIRDEKDAQQGVADARRTALQNLRDLNFELKDGALSEQDALLSLKEAQRDLAAGGFKDPLEQQRAQLRVAQAEQRLAEVRRDNSDLQQKANDANRKGVDGADEVVQANRRLEDSVQAVAKAQRDLTDTLNNQGAGGGGVDKVAQALAKLSPSARAFVLAVQAIKPAWDQMKSSVQETLFAGLADKIGPLAQTYLPLLGASMRVVAGALNEGANAMLGFLQSQQGIGVMTTLMGGASKIAADVSRAFAALLPGFAAIAAAASQVFSTMTGGLAGVAATWSNSLIRMQQTGELQSKIQGLVDIAKELGHVFGLVGGIIAGVFRAAASAGGGNPLGNITNTLQTVKGWVDSFQGQNALTSFFQSAGRVVAAVLPVFGKIAEVIGTTVAPIIANLAETIGPALVPAIAAIGEGLKDAAPSFADLGRFLADLIRFVTPLLPLLIRWAPEILAVVGAFKLLTIGVAAFNLVMNANPIVLILTAIVALGVALWAFFTKTEVGRKIWDTIWTGIKTAVEVAWGFIKPIFEALRGFVMDILVPAVMWLWQNVIQPAFSAIGQIISFWWNNLAKPVFDAWRSIIMDIVVPAVMWLWQNVIAPAFGAIGQIISGIWNGIIKPVWDAFKWAIDIVGQAATWLWQNVIVPAWNGIGQAIGFVWNSILKPIFDGIRAAWQGLGDAFRWVWDTIIKPVWDAFGHAVDVIRDAFHTGMDAIKATWDRLGDILKQPINFVINTVYTGGIKKVWDNTLGKVGLPSLPGIKPLATGGPVQAFATGGRIQGPGTGTSDSILATALPGSHVFTAREVANAGGFSALERLIGFRAAQFTGAGPRGAALAVSNGEYLADPSQVRDLGGHAAVYAIRRQLASGRVPGHDWGGIVNVITNPVGAAVNAGKNLARKGAAKAADLVFAGVDKLIPGEFTLGGQRFGDWGRLPKKTFGTFRKSAVDFIKGREKKAAGGAVPGKAFAESMDPAVYSMEPGANFTRTSIDCSGMVSATVNDILGRDPFESRMATPNEGEWLAERGFVDGLGGPGDVSVGWYDHGGGASGHTAMTLSDGTNVESNGSDGVVIGGPVGAADPMFENHMHLPAAALRGGDSGETFGSAPGGGAASGGGGTPIGSGIGSGGGSASWGNSGGGSQFNSADAAKRAGVTPVWVENWPATIGGGGSSVASTADLGGGTPSIAPPSGGGDLRQGATKEQITAEIVRQGKERGLSDEDIQSAVATALVESEMQNYANSNVAGSVDLPHDAVGADHDSVGIMQQRQSWGSTEELMDPAKAIGKYYDALEQVPGREGMTVGERAQAVQRSAFPGKYDERAGEAQQLIAGAGSASIAPTGTPPISTPSVASNYKPEGESLTGQDNTSAGASANPNTYSATGFTGTSVVGPDSTKNYVAPGGTTTPGATPPGGINPGQPGTKQSAFTTLPTDARNWGIDALKEIGSDFAGQVGLSKLFESNYDTYLATAIRDALGELPAFRDPAPIKFADNVNFYGTNPQETQEAATKGMTAATETLRHG